LIAADTVKRFAVYEIEIADILHERLDAPSHQRCPRRGTILVDLHQLMAVLFNALATKPNLVVNA
jgi:hypothetical protein